jgi:plastocyanin
MKILVLLAFVISSTGALGQQTPASQGPDYASGTNPNGEHAVLGCLVKDKGKFLVKEDATGNLYELQGRNDLQNFVNREVRVQGKTRAYTSGSNAFQLIAVDSIALVSECHTAPAKTSTSALGEPPVPEDAGQNPARANQDAAAAQRAEIGLPGGTLGVDTKGTQNLSHSAGRATVTINMAEDSYVPRLVTIHAGETVEWKNVSDKPHTVTVDPGKAMNRSDVALPQNARVIDSGIIPAGSTYKHAFQLPGTYRYFCTLDEGNGMVGEIVVKPR